MNSKILNHIVSAVITNERANNKHAALILPYKIADDGMLEYRWFKGGWSASKPKHIKVINDYGLTTKNRKRLDEIELDFLKTQYPAKPIKPTPNSDGSFIGWISPSGDYYYCMYGNHTASARSIVATLEDRLLDGVDAERYLLKTWLALGTLRDRPLILGRDENFDMTPAQFEIFEYIDKNFNTNFTNIDVERLISKDDPESWQRVLWTTN